MQLGCLGSLLAKVLKHQPREGCFARHLLRRVTRHSLERPRSGRSRNVCSNCTILPRKLWRSTRGEWTGWSLPWKPWVRTRTWTPLSCSWTRRRFSSRCGKRWVGRPIVLPKGSVSFATCSSRLLWTAGSVKMTVSYALRQSAGWSLLWAGRRVPTRTSCSAHLQLMVHLLLSALVGVRAGLLLLRPLKVRRWKSKDRWRNSAMLCLSFRQKWLPWKSTELVMLRRRQAVSQTVWLLRWKNSRLPWRSRLKLSRLL